MATKILRPNGVGSYSELSAAPGAGESNWEDVDEQAHDGDTSRVYTNEIPEKKDTYRLETPDLPLGAIIDYVKIYSVCRASGTLPLGYFTHYLKLGAELTVGVRGETNESYTMKSEILPRPGGGDWEVADFDTLEIGIGLEKSIQASSCRCTQIFVEVTYSVETFTITSSCGENGSINPSGLIEIPCGESIEFVIIPNSGYSVDAILVDGEIV